METPNPRSRIGGSRTGQLFSSRRGSLTVAIVAALAAGALFYLFAQHEKSSNGSAAAIPVNQTVFVAKQYIPAGTAAQTIIANGLLTRTVVTSNQVVGGAIADPSVITNTETDTAIAKGQQASVAEFSRTNISYSAYLSGYQRAMALTLDPEHGFTAHISPNDTVDMLFTSPKGPPKMIAQNVTVLGNTAGEVDIRVTDRQAITIAGDQDNAYGPGKIWLILRPSIGPKQSVGYSIPVTGVK